MIDPRELDVIDEAEAIVRLREATRTEVTLMRLEHGTEGAPRPDWATVEEWDELRAIVHEIQRRDGI